MNQGRLCDFMICGWLIEIGTYFAPLDRILVVSNAQLFVDQSEIHVIRRVHLRIHKGFGRALEGSVLGLFLMQGVACYAKHFFSLSKSQIH